MKRSKIQVKRIKVIDSLRQLLNDLQSSEEERKSIFRYWEYNSDLGDLYLLKDIVQFHIDDLTYQYHNYDDEVKQYSNRQEWLEPSRKKAELKSLKTAIRTYKKFYKLCPKNLYYYCGDSKLVTTTNLNKNQKSSCVT